jgi:AcrR family transcriptional regulator
MAKSAAKSQGQLRVDNIEILRVSARLFARKGFRGTTMDEVADAVGIAKPTLYVRARSKTAILTEIFEVVLAKGDETVEAARQQPTFRDAVAYLIRSWTKFLVAESEMCEVFYSQSQELPRPVAKEVQRRIHTVLDAIRSLIVEGQEHGELNPNVDARVTAFAILGVVSWTARWYRAQKPLDLDTIIDHLVTILATGLFVDGDVVALFGGEHGSALAAP